VKIVVQDRLRMLTPGVLIVPLLRFGQIAEFL
jgi:hypothetical protein